MRTTIWKLTAVTLLVAGCTKKGAAPAADTTAAAPAGTLDTTKNIASSDTAKGASGMNMDPDHAVEGTGVPAGYLALTDRPNTRITDAKYTSTGSGWEVQTGPAHIIYTPSDTASGVYAVSTTIQQLAKPRHPEAYGLFFGGQDLTDRAKQKYTYFLVRGTGEFLVKQRDGAKTVSVIDWKASPSVPKEDASGKATYNLKVHFAPDTTHFFVNDKLVAAVPRKGLSTNGVAGLRINHNLHVHVEPVKIAR